MADGQPSPKGRVLLRLPVGLHAALLTEARAQGTSLNQLAAMLLASGIGWQAAGVTRRTTDDHTDLPAVQ